MNTKNKKIQELESIKHIPKPEKTLGKKQLLKASRGQANRESTGSLPPITEKRSSYGNSQESRLQNEKENDFYEPKSTIKKNQ